MQHVTERDTFVPGSYWTPERARDAVRRMTATFETAEMQAAMDVAAHAAVDAGVPDEAPPSPAARAAPVIARAACRLRRGRPGDLPRFAELIAAAGLPPLFIEEFIEGFIAVEHDGEIAGCGGLEMYDDCGVLRSIAVDERARGAGLGREMAELLAEEARLAGARDLYLFTAEAWLFWQRLGYVDVPLEAWREPARQCWQYRFIAAHGDAVPGVHSMWRSVPAL